MYILASFTDFDKVFHAADEYKSWDNCNINVPTDALRMNTFSLITSLNRHKYLYHRH